MVTLAHNLSCNDLHSSITISTYIYLMQFITKVDQWRSYSANIAWATKEKSPMVGRYTVYYIVATVLKWTIF
jgi:hypothetical protein